MRIRKAILTGGGHATRLHPITTTINKHLIPLANKPMIFHAIEKAVEAGVEEIFINTNPGDTELAKHVGDGGHWGINIKFFEQTGGPQGIAHVVKEAQKFIGDEPFMFYLSDNILLGSLKGAFEEFSKEKYDCMLAFAQVPNANAFGVPIFDDKGTLIEVIEKPQNPPNNFAVTGMYLYGPRVFFDAFNHIERSARGEYEISDIHSYLLKNNNRVGWKEITGWWKDTGKPEDLLNANRMLLNQMPAEDFPNHGTVEQGAQISGNVHVGMGSRIASDVTIIGPVIIGENCVLEHCHLGPHVTIGSGVEIRNATIEKSIIFEHSVIDTDLHIKDSMIGKHVRLIKKVCEEKGRMLIIGDKTVVEM